MSPEETDKIEAKRIGDMLVRSLGPGPAEIIGIMMTQITDNVHDIRQMTSQLNFLRKKIKELEK